MTTLQDKIRGSLVGGAAGDALGYAVEFLSYKNIVQKYGTEGITRYDLNNEGVAEISDDTQMTLYTANGLLNDDVKAAYLEWYQTQATCGEMIANPKCWISKVPQMYARRAPGNTCMSALHNLAHGQGAYNDSKGCGGIMRVAPVAHYGVSMGLDKEQAMVQSCHIAQITHKHPLGWMPAGLLVYLLQAILETEEVGLHTVVNEALQSVKTLYNHFGMFDSAMRELSRGTSQAIMLAASPLPDAEAIRHLGEGWTGEEAWYIALFCTLRHFKDFEAAIIAAVNHDGDSDSTGAICGNLIGAIHGYDAIPQHLKQHLELHDVILEMADDLYNGQISKKEKTMNSDTNIKCGVTPENIASLKPNEVFVFGSNLGGHHGGGAAAFAMRRFGAVWGQGVGLQGQSYAIPTMQGGVETIKPYTHEFVEFAKANPDKHFYVTKIGCGIAGFTADEIAPLFSEALRLANVSLPQEFIEYNVPPTAEAED